MPVFSGGRWFQHRTPQNQNMKVVEVAESINGPWRCVVDLNEIANGRTLNVDDMVPSPDGQKLLVSFGVDGVEMAELRVYEVDSGKVLMPGLIDQLAIMHLRQST